MTETLRPGATIGILGGGQLGRMLAMAAARLGYRVHIFDPDPAAPAAEMARTATHAGYNDPAIPSGMPTSPMDPVPSETGFRWG